MQQVWRVILTFVLTAGASHVRAVTIELPASHDATIFQNNPDNGSGGGNGLFAGTNGAKSPRRGLIAFDVSTIPAGATIQSAVLNLTLGQIAGSGGGGNSGPATSTIDLHRISSSWGEGATQHQSMPSDNLGQMGQGAPAENGDVTWNDRFFASTPATPWTNSGGDFSPTVSSTLTVGTTLDVPYSWPSTSALVADVQGWLAAPASNFGWMLINADELTATNFRTFYTREVLTTAFHPKLTVTYLAPSLSADFDGDHDADGVDLLAWQRGLGITTGALRQQGDATGEGAVTALDLEKWRQQFGMTSPATAVPEPGSALLALGFAATVAAARRCTRLGSGSRGLRAERKG